MSALIAIAFIVDSFEKGCMPITYKNTTLLLKISKNCPLTAGLRLETPQGEVVWTIS